MTSTYDYALLDFAASLAKVEMNFSENLQSIIDTFASSRLDLPLKRLCEIGKVHGRASRNLKKMLDPKKNEHINLWKLCNIYSAISVDLDKAMRETRAYLRTKMQIDGTPVEKPKKRTILNNLLATKTVEHEEKPGWLKRFTKEEREKRHEARASRKNTGSSLEREKEVFDEIKEVKVCKSTPPTPPTTRSIPLKATVSIPQESSIRPPKLPPRVPLPASEVVTTSSIVQNQAPPVVTAPLPAEDPVPTATTYAPTIYGELQKTALLSDNQRRLIEEHSLRHTDDKRKDISVVKIRTNVDVEKQSSRNETTVTVFDNPSRNDYVNLRPPIAQKPKIIPVESSSYDYTVNSSPSMVRMRSYDVATTDRAIPPTMISVECPSHPTPSPRSYFSSIDTPMSSSQRSSSSAYSSNYSSSSSTNVTTFNIEANSRPTSEIEHTRMIRIESPDAASNRF